MADLLGVVVTELAAVGSLAKLEGDAVFVCSRDGATDGETLLAAFDAAYFAFARRRRTIEVRSTCTCEACARIPSLDLKLIAHRGFGPREAARRHASAAATARTRHRAATWPRG
jgi:hypothetical protein